MPDIEEKPRLLLVDDDPLISETLAYVLRRDFEVLSATTRPEALAKARLARPLPEIALVDLGLPPAPHKPNEGFALITELLALGPGIQIVILSGQSDEANARHARTLGAVDFIAKPVDPDDLRNSLRSLLTYGAEPDAAEIELVGSSPPMEKLRSRIRQYANSPYPVLIEGESGSGKELVANALHRLSDRKSRPFLALNCAAIPQNLVEPTLFGHAKGAFTGAVGALPGYFEEAADGTLFLDEIGELPLDLQPKLLRVLENGQFQRVGETRPRLSQARIIAATNRDLKRETREGRFRADLYHRLSVLTIEVPPLREMGRDRFLLLEHYSRRHAGPGRGHALTLTPEAKARWAEYHFPGNVRELRNIVIRLLAKHDGRPVGLAELNAELDAEIPRESDDLAFPLSEAQVARVALRQLRENPHFDLAEILRQWEYAYIKAAQQLAKNNISQAARLLGLNRTTLYNRIDILSRSRGDRGQDEGP